jgi:hypothetical protein
LGIVGSSSEQSGAYGTHDDEDGLTGWLCGEGTSVFAIFTALIGFLTTLVLTVVLLNELMPRGLTDWQRASRNRLVILGFCIFFLAWIGAYVGYLFGS